MKNPWLILAERGLHRYCAKVRKTGFWDCGLPDMDTSPSGLGEGIPRGGYSAALLLEGARSSYADNRTWLHGAGFPFLTRGGAL